MGRLALLLAAILLGSMNPPPIPTQQTKRRWLASALHVFINLGLAAFILVGGVLIGEHRSAEWEADKTETADELRALKTAMGLDFKDACELYEQITPSMYSNQIAELHRLITDMAVLAADTPIETSAHGLLVVWTDPFKPVSMTDVESYMVEIRHLCSPTPRDA